MHLHAVLCVLFAIAAISDAFGNITDLDQNSTDVSAAKIDATEDADKPLPASDVVAEPEAPTTDVSNDTSDKCGLACLKATAGALVQAEVELTRRLYQFLADDDAKRNVIAAPLSAAASMSMAMLGAGGTTRDEIKRAFGYDKLFKSDRMMLAAIGRMASSLTDSDSSGLHLASHLFVQSGFDVKRQFAEALKLAFDSEVARVDFTGDAAAARDAINAQVAESSGGKIVEMLDASDVDELTRLLILSTANLQATWASPFDVAETAANGQFHVDEATTRNDVAMMHQKSVLYHAEDDDVHYVMLPFAKANESMTLRMALHVPKKRHGLSAWHAKLDSQEALEANWAALNFQPKTVDLTMPRFKFDMSIDLKDFLLLELAVVEAFTPEANFTGISDEQKLSVGVVKQKTTIDVDENGAEASAATAVGMSIAAGAPPKESVVVVADHPFSFDISDENGLIFFVGRVANP